MENEIVIDPDKRFVTIKRFCQKSGLSYATVNHMLKTGQLKFITTEAGLRRIDTQAQETGSEPVLEKLEMQEKIMRQICDHFGIQAGAGR